MDVRNEEGFRRSPFVEFVMLRIFNEIMKQMRLKGKIYSPVTNSLDILIETTSYTFLNWSTLHISQTAHLFMMLSTFQLFSHQTMMRIEKL